jgi:hypothetical protein
MKTKNKHHPLCTESDKPIKGCKICKQLYDKYSITEDKTDKTIINVINGSNSFSINKK